MKRRCCFRVRSFDGGVEIGGHVTKEYDDDEELVGPLRLLVKNDKDTAAVFSALKKLIDRFGEYAEDFLMDWASCVAKEMSASEFLKRIDKVDYVSLCYLPWEQERIGRGLRVDGYYGVFVFPNDWKEEE